MTPHEELKGILDRLRAGDETAARDLCERFTLVAAAALGTLRGRRAGRTISASELVQSCVLRVLTNLDTITDGIDDLPAFLRTIARNRLRDRLDMLYAAKRDARREEYGDAAAAVTAGGPSPAEAAVMAEEYEAVMRWLAAGERELAELRLAGLEWGEIAGELGLPSGDAARKQWERLKARLREKLGGIGE